MNRWLISVGVSILLSGAAQAQTAEPFPADELLSYLGDLGAQVSWANRIETAGMTILQDVELIRYGKRLAMDDLRTDGAVITASGLKVETITEGGDGLILIDAIEMTDKIAFLEIFDHVNAVPFSDLEDVEDPLSDIAIDPDQPEIPDSHFGDVCAGLEADGSVTFSWSARGVQMVGDLDALPESMSRSEELRLQTVREDSEFRRDGDMCSATSRLAFLGMDVLAIDGARGSVRSGSIGSTSEYSFGDDANRSEYVLQMDGLSVSNSEGVVSAFAGQVSHSRVSDEHMDILLCDLLWPHEDMTSAKMLERALATRSGGRLDVSGIWLSVPDFLPPYMIEVMGLQGVDEISGAVSAQGTLDDGIADFDLDLDLPDLALAGLDGRFSLPTSLDATLPGFIADKLPIPGELLDMKVHHLSASFDDQGAGGIVQALTGMSPADHVGTRLELVQARVANKLPPFVAEKLTGAREAIVQIVENGGRVEIAPAEPQTVMSIAMQGMMNPDGLTANMGMSVEIDDRE